jgi:putative transposase
VVWEGRSREAPPYPDRDHFQYVRGMEHYRRTAHTRFDIKLHLVWITKYRKKLLRGEVGIRLRQIVRTIGAELEVEILKGHVSVDHAHLFVSCPPHVSASYLMQRVKGKSSRRLLQEYSYLNKECWGRHLWARGFFVASSGNVTDEVILEYIRTQDMAKDDDDFRVNDG